MPVWPIVTTSGATDLVTLEDVVLVRGPAERIVARHPKFINPRDYRVPGTGCWTRGWSGCTGWWG